ncbi:hypothetical protein H0H93_014656 [Arthromyces matolae]|nr:hypothetical protein H0H93_014656 [Arthromyces matolae]
MISKETVWTSSLHREPLIASDTGPRNVPYQLPQRDTIIPRGLEVEDELINGALTPFDLPVTSIVLSGHRVLTRDSGGIRFKLILVSKDLNNPEKDTLEDSVRFDPRPIRVVTQGNSKIFGSVIVQYEQDGAPLELGEVSRFSIIPTTPYATVGEICHMVFDCHRLDRYNYVQPHDGRSLWWCAVVLGVMLKNDLIESDSAKRFKNWVYDENHNKGSIFFPKPPSKGYFYDPMSNTDGLSDYMRHFEDHIAYCSVFSG